MIARIPETKKKPGVCYAPTDDGVELPVIDITHPAFALGLSEDDLAKRTEAYIREQERWERFMERAQAISEAKLAAKVGQTIEVIVDEVDDEGATCRTKADAPEIDGNLFIDEDFERLNPGDIVTVEVEEAGEYDLWGRLAQ